MIVDKCSISEFTNEILYQDIENAEVQNPNKASKATEKITVGQLLDNEYSNISNGAKSVNNINGLISAIGDMNIYLYSPTGIAEKPMYITAVNYDVPEYELISVTGYDEYGNTIQIDAVNEPDFPVLVLGISERPDPELLLDNDLDPKTLGGSYIKLKTLRVVDIWAIETWILGDAELYFMIVHNDGSGISQPTAQKYYRIKRSDSNVILTYNTSLLSWDTNFYGDKIGGFFIEDDADGDPGFTIAFDVFSISSKAYTKRFYWADDYAGDFFMYSADADNSIYGTGTIEDIQIGP